jgi:hypothetical protein
MRAIVWCLLGCVGATAAHAEVDLIQVPAVCGTSAEIGEFLSALMRDPVTLGRGRDARGQDVAVLRVGRGYWAMLADDGSGTVCIIASGHEWLGMSSASGQTE